MSNLKEELRRVHDSGLNIYALINRTKRELRAYKSHIPDQVLLKVCEHYWFEKNNIRRAFPWFIKVLKMEWMAYNANAQIQMNEKIKREYNSIEGIEALASILTRVMSKVNANKSVSLPD